MKAVKRLVQKVSDRGNLDNEAFAYGLLEVRADGRSPVQILYGHPQRSAVPAHHRAFAEVWQRAAEQCDERAAVLKSQTAERYDASARSLRPL